LALSCLTLQTAKLYLTGLCSIRVLFIPGDSRHFIHVVSVYHVQQLRAWQWAGPLVSRGLLAWMPKQILMCCLHLQVDALVLELARCDGTAAAVARATLPALTQVQTAGSIIALCLDCCEKASTSVNQQFMVVLKQCRHREAAGCRSKRSWRLCCA
jgi:hypothetical protein